MAAAAYSDYARVMLALPGTSAAIAQRVGMRKGSTRLVLRRLWALDLVHPCDGEVTLRHTAAIWAAGIGARPKGLRVVRTVQPTRTHARFALAWRALEDGASARAMAARSGICTVTAYRLLASLREMKAIHICGWERDGRGHAMAVWALGKGHDAKKPPPLERDGPERFARSARHRAVSILTHLGRQQ